MKHPAISRDQSNPAQKNTIGIVDAFEICYWSNQIVLKNFQSNLAEKKTIGL